MKNMRNMKKLKMETLHRKEHPYGKEDSLKAVCGLW